MAKSRESGVKPKRTALRLTGTARAPVAVDAVISDPEYKLDTLSDDIKYQRVWFEGPADADGWMLLMYSADGPTGDPWQVGKIRFSVDPGALEAHFGDISDLSVRPAKK